MAIKILTQEELEGIHCLEIEMLRCFIDICEKLQLKYYLLDGTLLGTVRHQGFIPWDDDIDVGMPRNDYEIFLAEAPKYLPEHLFLQSKLSEKNLPINFSKIRHNDTAFMETSLRKVNIHKGVFIDIFPLDYYPNDVKVLRKMQRKKKWLEYCTIKAFYYEGNKKFKLKLAFLRSLTFFVPYRTAVKRKEKLFMSQKEGSMLIIHNGAWGMKECVPIEWYGEGTYLEFEGMQVRVPCCYDLWLRQVYGDYMKLPPEEKRVSHHNIDIFDLHNSYERY